MEQLCGPAGEPLASASPGEQNAPMLALLIGAAVLGQGATAKAILAEARAKLEHATSVTVTVITTTKEFPKPTTEKWAFRNGGYLRAEFGNLVRVANPKSAWEYSPTKKTYRSIPPPTRDVYGGDVLSKLALTLANFPVLGGPTNVAWHGMKTLRIELDARKTMTKETKLFAFFDPQTHLPLGVSANLGSVTQVMILKDLKLNPRLDDRLFEFKPPAGWTKLKD
jgi:outer membrane lipoprotein-sorting protein